MAKMENGVVRSRSELKKTSQTPISRQARTAIALLWMVLLCRFVDQNILGILLEAIRKDFALSDIQLGIVGGLAFAVVYGVLGLPFAWLADRTRKKPIIAISLAAWSGFTTLGSLASGFWSLCISRIGVGVAEAGGTAPAFSLLSDYFPKARRSTVLAIVNTSIPIGVFVAYLIGGWANQIFGWRAALLIVGLPGFVLALFVWVLLKEPGQIATSPVAGQGHQKVLYRDAIGKLWRIRTYRHLIAGNTVLMVGAQGSGVWIASYFMRTHGMSSGQIGTWLALIYGIGGTFGTLLGGALADHVMARTGNAKWYTRIPAFSIVAVLPFSLITYLSESATPALLIHFGTVVFMHMGIGPTYGTIQNLAERSYRTTAAAINLLIANVVAVGGGPVLVGYLSDEYATFIGNDSLRYAILTTVMVMYTWACIHFLIAGRSIEEDFARVRD